MARPVAFALLILIEFSTAGARLQAAPWFKRPDPDITTHLFVYRTHLTLLDRRLGVYPFVIVQGGEPPPPEFGPLLTQALLQEGSAVSVTQVPGAPWDQTPDWDASRWREASRERGFDFVVLGRVDSFFRTAAQGLTAKVTVWLISTQDGAVVWYGSKKAEWLRGYSVEECVLRLAWSFAIGWRPPSGP